MSDRLRVDALGRARCWWPGDAADCVVYHDDEWGRPVVDDRQLLEKLSLEGFQSGLSWMTILRKRENFRRAFAGFEPTVVARFDEGDVERLLGDAGIVRHRGKIEATINNARRCADLVDEFGSFAAYIWGFEPAATAEVVGNVALPSQTPASVQISKDLKRRGWRFVGPTTVYAFMQAMGLVNDHVEGCEWRAVCDAEREALVRP
jgi:DNA-3-methyladenine glycosylase I